MLLTSFKKLKICCLLLLVSYLCNAEINLKLQLKSDHGFQYAGYYAAQWQNYYKNQGLNVEFITQTQIPSQSGIDEVINKNADLGIGNFNVLLKIDEGHDLVILSPIFQKSPTSFYSLKKNPINSINDLVKLNIAVQKDSFVHLELISLFKLHGFNSEQINFKFIKPTIENLLNNNVDVIAPTGIKYFQAYEKVNNQLNQIKINKFSGNFYGDVIYTHRSTLTEKANEISSFLESSYRGWDFAIKNKLKIIEIIEERYPSETISRSEFHSYNQYFAENIEEFLDWPKTPIGYSSLNKWFSTYTQLKNIGILKNDWSIKEHLLINESPTEFPYLSIIALIFLLLIIVIQILNINRIPNFKISFLISGVLIIALLYVSEKAFIESSKQQSKLNSLQQLNTISAKLIEIINSNLSILKGLAAHISTNPDINQQEFNNYCEQVFPKTGVIINLAAAPNLIVNKVYPLEGNRGVLGLNYNLNQPQRELALRVKEKGDIVVAGPVKLVQGGEGIIGRMAVMTNGQEQTSYWGIVSVPLNLQKILLLAGIYNSNFDIAIRGKDGLGKQGDVFYGNPALFEDNDRLEIEIQVGDGTWTISALSLHKYANHIWLLRILAAFLLALLFYFLYIKQEQLNKRKSFQRLLDNNKKLLLEVGELAHIGGWRINSSGQILQWTAEKDTVLGKNFPTLIETVNDFVSVFDSQQAQFLLTKLKDSYENGIKFDIECFYTNQNANKRWLRVITDEIIATKNGYEVTGAIQDITDYKDINQKLEYQTKHDNLTGLINRKEFASLLSMALMQAKISNSTIAVLYIDVDDFKSINDNLGHETGDQLLIYVAQKIQLCLTSTNLLSRYSGDEFVAFIDYNDKTSLKKKIKQILKNVSQPFEINNSRIYSSCSIGVSIFPNNSETAEELINQANLAMYEVKNNGKNNVGYYSNELLLISERKVQLRNKLFHAFSNNEFEVHYQPIINLDSHEIEKIEALVRWKDSDDYYHNTEEFIKVAEESGLINEIDLFVIDESIQAVNVLKATENEEIEISFNVSPSLFISRRKSLDKWLNKIIQLRKHIGIMIEITEHSLVQNPEKTKIILERLKEADIKISIDDFGVGYSSLIYLTQFPINQIKIDRSFVAEIGQNSKSDLLIEVILNLAKDLDIKVVAEGIENESQLNFLINRHCDFGQGYFFCKAHPIEYLADKMKNKY